MSASSRPRSSSFGALATTLLASTGVLLAAVSAGCGSKAEPKAPEPPPVAAASAAPVEEAPAKPEPKAKPAFPTACAGEAKEPCVPDGDFVKRICEKPLGDVALALFQKETPFTRGYLTREVDGWNASGGGSSREKVPFDEEVLVLRVRAVPKGAMQMSGQGGYDVLRWDGSCISLATEEMTQKKPPRARHAAIPFRYLGEKTQLALLSNEKVKTTYEARRKECKGVTTGDVSAKCEKLDKDLSTVIVDFVRGGGAVPRPLGRASEVPPLLIRAKVCPVMPVSLSRRAGPALLLGTLFVWSALPACNLVIGGDDKVLVGLGTTNGGAAGDGATGGAQALVGGEGGTSTAVGGGAGASGSAGSNNLGGGSGKAGGGGQVGGFGGSSAGGAGAAGGLPVYTKPGSLDCDDPSTIGLHRFCTDFVPLPVGWAGAGCSLQSAEDGNVYWRWEQNAGSTCGSFVNVSLGTLQGSATMAMWLRVDALGLGDGKVTVQQIRVGDAKGELAVRVERDGSGVVVGTSLLVQTTDAVPQLSVIGAFPLSDWRHVRLRVATDGSVRGSFGATTADTIASGEVATTKSAPAMPYIELPFRQTTQGTAPTRISVDEITIDVTD